MARHDSACPLLARALKTALLGALALGVSGPARARAEAPPPVSVLGLFSPPSLMGLAGLLTRKAVDAAKKQPDAQVVPPELAEAKVGRDNLHKLAGCQLKPACIASYGSGVGTPRILAGSIDRDEVHYVLKLILVDVASGAAVATAERTVLIASRQLQPEFEAMLPNLLAGKSTGPARLTITSKAKHARVTLDDKELGEAPITVEVSPGKHELRLEKPNYLPVDRFVEAEAGRTLAIDQPLTLLPNHVDPDEAAVALTEHVGPPEASASSTGGVPLPSWIALGAGVALAGAGTYFALSEQSLVKQAYDSDGDGALNLTRVQAQEGHRDATLANVGFGLAGAAVITAVVIYFVDRPSSGEASGSASSATVGAVPLPGGALTTFGMRF